MVLPGQVELAGPLGLQYINRDRHVKNILRKFFFKRLGRGVLDYMGGLAYNDSRPTGPRESTARGHGRGAAKTL